MNWEHDTPFWEVFVHFLIGKGLIFGPIFGLEKFLSEHYSSNTNNQIWLELAALGKTVRK